jgi:two-component sensor histidine kinase
VKSRLYIFITLYIFPIFLFGSDSAIIDIANIKEGAVIDQSIQITPDSNYDIHQLIQLPNDLFSHYDWEAIPEGKSINWLKIEFKNKSNNPENLVIGTSRYDFIYLFYQNESGEWTKSLSGLKVANKEKKLVFNSNSYLEFTIKKNSSQTIYIRCENHQKQSYQYNPIPFTIYHKDTLVAHQNKQSYFTYFFLGAILIMTLYHLFIYFQVKSKIYLFYVLNNIGILTFVISQTGLLSIILFQNFSYHENLVLTLGNFAFVLYILFVRSFLNYKELSPKKDKVFKYTAIAYPFLLIFILINTSIAVALGGIIALSFYTYIIISSFIAAKKGQTDARLFFLGNLFYYFGIVISILQATNIFPYEFLDLSAINYVEIGTIIQLTLFALTVGFRISTLQKQIISKESEHVRIQRIEEEKRLEITEEKNKELERKVEERTKDLAIKNKDLELAVKDKELLLKEIHHRVKNNLQLTSSLLSLQSKQVKDKNVRIALKEGQARIKSMSLVHQQLYQNNTFSEINFGRYIEKLVPNIQHTFDIGNKNISIKIDGDIAMDIERAIPIALISNELITNSFKYAFKNSESGELTIQDNGKGLEKLKIEEFETLGLNLVQMLTKQLHGNIDIKSNGGLVIVITFPKEIEE